MPITKQFISPDQAKEAHKDILLAFEKTEIDCHPQVYFVGTSQAKSLREEQLARAQEVHRKSPLGQKCFTQTNNNHRRQRYVSLNQKLGGGKGREMSTFSRSARMSMQQRSKFQAFRSAGGAYRVIKGDHLAYRYETLSILGEGTFGIVVKCFDHKLNKHVAIKMAKVEKEA